ncbi:MAG: GIY-YIG nuclease family protein [Candidatus Omnitrophica bacterium]|nr:GIY-YIG nuclease family protein [Candidatus Omnitrophota bacterium]
MYYVYVLQNEAGRHYIGSCGDIEKRLKRHNQNSVRATKARGPFRVVYREGFSSRTEARRRENEIKSYKGNDRFKRLLTL